MNAPDRLDSRVREMLDDIPPHDDSARRATLAALPTTPQRRYRWLPPFGHGGRLRVEPVHVGATIVLVLVLAVATLAGLSERNPLGPAASDGYFVALPFEGRVTCAAAEAVDGVAPATGIGPLEIVEISDARLHGTVTDAWNRLEVSTRAGSSSEIATATWRIENEAGAWQGSFPSVSIADGAWLPTVAVLHGEGDYDGLAALAELSLVPGEVDDDCSWDVRGLLVAADELPTSPEAVSR